MGLMVAILRHGLMIQIAKEEKTLVEIEKELAKKSAQLLNITIPQIKFFLNKLKIGDIDNIKYRKSLINIFVNAIYLYNDKLTLN